MIDFEKLIIEFEKLGYTQEELEKIADAFNAVSEVYLVPLETLQKAMEAYKSE